MSSVALRKEDRHLTTFMVPCGKYHFNMVPQGLNESPDQFNVKGDHVIAAVERAEKSMDDILNHPRTCQEA